MLAALKICSSNSGVWGDVSLLGWISSPLSLARRCRRHIYTLLPTIELGFQLFPSRPWSDAHALQKSLTDIVQISILIQIKKKSNQKKIIFKGKKHIKSKKKKTELSSQLPFSFPSAFPNGFSPLSSRREVNCHTITM
jgi:hypothetical protein